MNLDAPATLPAGLKNLSHSSVELYLKCPQKWYNRYVLKQYEPRPGYLMLGSAIHKAESQSYQEQVKTAEPQPLEQVMDEYSTSLRQEIDSATDEIDWGDMTAGEQKDRGARMLAEYHSTVPSKITPKVVESEFNIRLRPEYTWTIKGYVDIVGDWNDPFMPVPNVTHDLKTVKRAIPEDDLENSVQGTLYTYSQLLQQPELDVMPFFVHELKALKTVQSARVLFTQRTRVQGERYMERVAQIVREIDWRMETGNWQGAPPGAWWCRPKMCGFYSTCPFAAGRP